MFGVSGMRFFGQVNNTERSFVTARFFHINYIPLFPTSCWIVMHGEAYKLPRFHWPAILHGYSKILLIGAVLVGFGSTMIELINASERSADMADWMMVVGILLISLLSIVAYYGMNRGYNELFTGAHEHEAIIDEFGVEEEISMHDSW